MELKVNSKENCYQFSPEMIKQIQEQTSVSTTLEPGIYHLKIKTGSFSSSQDASKGIPTLNLWIYGKFINLKANSQPEIEATWLSLHGYDDVLNIEVRESTTVCCRHSRLRFSPTPLCPLHRKHSMLPCRRRAR